MQAKAFFAGIRAIHVALPFGKKIDDESLTFLWMTVESSVKRDVTDEMWAHACKELIANWNPDSVINRPIHMQALSYLYRQRDGAPAFDWGMKEEICKQFSLPVNYGRAQLPASSESIAAGWGGQGLLEAERSRSTDNFLDL